MTERTTTTFELIPFTNDPRMFDAFRRHFTPFGINVHLCDYSVWEHPHDAVVSPANSFGIMDGGLDLVLRDKYPGVQEVVQKHIHGYYRGEQPVGTSFIASIPNTDRKIVHSPTMRTPSRVIDVTTIYHATYATFLQVQIFNALRSEKPLIKTLAISGMGALTGGLSPDMCARVMAKAWWNFKSPQAYTCWAEMPDMNLF